MSYGVQVTQLAEHVNKLKKEAAAAEAVFATAEMKLFRQAEAVEQAMQQYKRIKAEVVISREAADDAKNKLDVSSQLLGRIGSALDNFNLLQAEIKVRLNKFSLDDYC